MAALLARAMVVTFGNGLLASSAAPSAAGAAAVLFGALAWVLLATRRGLPVSTTHAIVGSLVGVAVVSLGVDGVRWGALGGKVLLPLLLSPAAALVLVFFLLRLALRRPPAGSQSRDCLCAEVTPSASLEVSTGTAAFAARPAQLGATGGVSEVCAIEHPRSLRLSLEHLHWLGSGATSLARGVNDAPKIVALVLGGAVLSGQEGTPASGLFLFVALGMVTGSVTGLGGRRHWLTPPGCLPPSTGILAEAGTPPRQESATRV